MNPSPRCAFCHTPIDPEAPDSTTWALLWVHTDCLARHETETDQNFNPPTSV